MHAGLGEQSTDSTEVRKGANNTTQPKDHQRITHLQVSHFHLVCSDVLLPAKHSCPSHTKQLSVSSLLPSGCHLCCLIFFNSLTSICWLAAVTPRTLMPHADRYSNPWGLLWGNGVGGTNRNSHQNFKAVRRKGLKCLSPVDAFWYKRQ